MTNRPFTATPHREAFSVVNTDNGRYTGKYPELRRAELEAISSNDVVSMNAGEAPEITRREAEELDRLRLMEALLHYFGKKSKIARALGAEKNSEIVYLRRVMSGGAKSSAVMKRLQTLLDTKVKERGEDAASYL